MTEELVLRFLRERQALLNFKGLADAASLNERTLRSYVAGTRGSRGIPEDVIAALTHAIEGLRAPWPTPGSR